MATTRKRTVTRSKSTAPRRRTTAAPAARPRRRVTRKKKGMLSELFNPALAQSGVKAMVSGAAGGFAATTIIKMTPQQSPLMQAAIIGGGSFVAATMLKAPNLAAGMASIAVYKLMENAGMLADDMNLASFADPIEALPAVLNEDGSQNMYLSDAMYLSDDSYQVAYAPNFAGM